MVGRVLLLLLLASPAAAQQVAVFGNLVACADCTVQPPEATTGASSSIGQTTATIAGTCNPRGIPTDGYFEVGTSPAFELADTATQSLGSGTSAAAIGGGSLTGLTCGTTYLYRAFCQHTPSGGTDFGDTATFDTSACPPTPTPPTVVTSAESGVTSSSATLNGTCDPEGFTAVCRFQWGPSTGTYTGATSPTPDVSVGGGTDPVACSAGISNLSASTTYYTRIQCENAGGTSNGSEDTLTTSAAPGGAKRMITSADFTLDGFWNVIITGNENQMCLTHKDRGGVIHLQTMAGGAGAQVVREFNPNAFAFGSTINTLTRTWSNVGGQTTTVGNTDLRGCFWASDGKFWTVSAASYSSPTTTNIYTRTLADDQTVSNILGPYLLTGVTQKWVYGGVVEIPAALQAAWGGAYLVGWGGATSTVAASGGSSIGLAAFAIPDPGTLTPNVTTASFETLSLHSGTHGSPNCALVTCDRGTRSTSYGNFQDNDNRTNPQSGRSMVVNTNGTAVSFVSGSANFQFNNPASGTNSPSWWIGNGYTVRINGVNYGVSAVASNTALTLASSAGVQNGVTLVGPNARPLYSMIGDDWTNEIDGTWRQGLYDGYWSGCQLIYETASQGLVCDFQGDSGHSWYRESNIERDGKVTERHFYNPDHLSEVNAGTRQPWQVQPVEMVTVTTSGLDGSANTQNLTPRGAIHASTWDATNKKWYSFGCKQTSPYCKLYRYSVNVN